MSFHEHNKTGDPIHTRWLVEFFFPTKTSDSYLRATTITCIHCEISSGKHTPLPDCFVLFFNYFPQISFSLLQLSMTSNFKPRPLTSTPYHECPESNNDHMHLTILSASKLSMETVVHVPTQTKPQLPSPSAQVVTQWPLLFWVGKVNEPHLIWKRLWYHQELLRQLKANESQSNQLYVSPSPGLT